MIQVTTLPQMQKTNVAVWLKVLLAVHVQSEVNFKLDIQTVARFLGCYFRAAASDYLQHLRQQRAMLIV